MNQILRPLDAVDVLDSKKVVAFDLDGTLTESKQPLGPEMGELISKLLQKTDVAVISGGSIEQFKKQFFSGLPHKLQFSHSPHTLHILPVSGSQRYELDTKTSEWNLFDSVPFPQDVKEKVLHELADFEKTYAGMPEFDLPADTELYGSRTEERGTQITFSAFGQQAPIDIKKAWDPNLVKREKIWAYLSDRLSNEVRVNIGGSTSLDILPKGFDKAVGLTRFLSKIGMNPSELVFVGDAVFEGGNDYSPLVAGITTIGVEGPDETAQLIRSWVV